MQGHRESIRMVRGQKAGAGEVYGPACTGISMGKTRQDRVKTLGFRGLNNSSGLRVPGRVPSFLIPGSGMI